MHGMYEGWGKVAGVRAKGCRPQVRRDIWELEHVMRGWPVRKHTRLD